MLNSFKSGIYAEYKSSMDFKLLLFIPKYSKLLKPMCLIFFNMVGCLFQSESRITYADIIIYIDSNLH